MRITHHLKCDHRTQSIGVEVRAVKHAGDATGRVTVTCDGQTRQFVTMGRHVDVRVQSGSSTDSTVRVDIQGDDEAP